MYDALLIVHFIGLSIGAGTSIYLLAIRSYALKNEPQNMKNIMMGPAGAVSKVGAYGLLLLLLSGIIMIVLRGSDGLDWAFTAKMVAVVLIVALVGVMQVLQKRARQATGPEPMLMIKKLSPLGPILALAAIGFAVLAFH